MAEAIDRRAVALGVDLGRVRMGLAISDATGMVASPIDVRARKGNNVDAAWVARLAQDKRAAAIVVGMPLHADGTEGQSARLCRGFARVLAGATALPVWLVEEGGTSAEAEGVLRELGLRSAARRAQIDRVAAARILERFLEGAPAERVDREAHVGG